MILFTLEKSFTDPFLSGKCKHIDYPLVIALNSLNYIHEMLNILILKQQVEAEIE